MAIRPVLLLGDPALYERSAPVEAGEVAALGGVVDDLRDTLFEFRRRFGAGRGIAAPQIGVRKRLVYLHLDRPIVLFNPRIESPSEAMFEVWDDCMCFPDLLVRVRRHRRCRVRYRDEHWQEQVWDVEDAVSELVQHECDHLDGILAVSRAIDAHSFALRSQRGLLQV